MSNIEQISDTELQFYGDLAAAFESSKRILLSEGGKLKSADLQQGKIDVRFRYGINLSGLRIKLNFEKINENTSRVAVVGDFVDSIDTFGTAKKKAISITQKLLSDMDTETPIPIAPPHTQISTSVNNISGQIGTLGNSNFLPWLTLIIVALTISGIPTGLGIFLVPFFGLTGALLTLPLSRWLAKRAHNIFVIDPQNPDHSNYQELYLTVSELAEKAGIPTPEVGVYKSKDMNAFATGMNPKNSIVAFSSALLEKLTPSEVQAVAAHEVGHIVSKDMMAMAFFQGLTNSLILLCTLPLQLARLLVSSSQDKSAPLIDWLIWLLKAALTVMLTFFGSLALKAFSRRREYRADAIAALLVGKEGMISALRKISVDAEEAPLQQKSYSAMKISTKQQFAEWFSTHPLIESRIQALELETHTRPSKNKATKAEA